MSEYRISSVSENDSYTNEGVTRLLEKENIRRDRNLDYTCAMLDEDYQVIATGSLYMNTLRCMAVDSSHQGEALMNDIVSHLIEVQYQRGNYHLFLYTKCNTAAFFQSLGFREIARVEGQVVFMENKSSGFNNYLAELRSETEKQLERLSLNASEYLPYPSCEDESENEGSSASISESAIFESAAASLTGSASNALTTSMSSFTAGSPLRKPRISALVMNANPFTLGHRYLIEKALSESDLLHIFMVSEDSSLIPFSVRKKLILEGCQDLKNIIFHDSGSYIISSATFPAYFQRDEEAVILSQANLDLKIFRHIAYTLGIKTRYVGEEKASLVTSLYNQVMKESLPSAGIECHIIPRLSAGGAVISASTVRALLKEGSLSEIKSMVPDSTYRFFSSPEAEPVLKKLRDAWDVVHY